MDETEKLRQDVDGLSQRVRDLESGLAEALRASQSLLERLDCLEDGVMHDICLLAKRLPRQL